MPTGDRDFPSKTAPWLPADSAALPPISRQDLQAMEALFENLDPESVQRDLQPKSALSVEPLEWDLVDLIA